MYLILSASPNSDGLTAACAAAALEGVLASGKRAQKIDLCKLTLGRCRQCGNGWGRCRSENTCIVEDDLVMLQESIRAAAGIIIITPVYFGEMSESAKIALDRVRRCELTLEGGRLKEKPVIAVAAAGGSGRGLTTCLLSMERWIEHTRAQVADLIGITKRSRDYKLATIRAAAEALATE